MVNKRVEPYPVEGQDLIPPPGGAIAIPGEWPLSVQAYLCYSLFASSSRSVVWVTDGPKSLDHFYPALKTLAGGLPVVYFPAREQSVRAQPVDLDVEGDRLDVLRGLLQRPAPSLMVATCIQALMDAVPTPDSIRKNTLDVRVGMELDPATLLAFLQQQRFVFSVEVQQKMQASHRGGIIDCWPPHVADPVRIEFFGEEVESIRYVDAVRQTSLEKIERIELLSVFQEGLDCGSLLEYFDAQTLLGLGDPAALSYHGSLYQDRTETDDRPSVYPFQKVRDFIENAGPSRIYLGDRAWEDCPARALDIQLAEPLSEIAEEGFHPDLADSVRRLALTRWQDWVKRGGSLTLFTSTDGVKNRMAELLRSSQVGGDICIEDGFLPEGFTVPALRWACVAEADLYGGAARLAGRYDRPPTSRRPYEGQRIDQLADLSPGDFVVHVDHGIGKYLGIFEIKVNDEPREVLAIEYADDAKIYLTLEQTHLLSRYIGAGRKAPRLHSLGGRRWMREKESAERAVRDLAAGLLETQAARSVMQGHRFGPDVPWQHEFERSFPYEETRDQIKALEDVKKDMESPRPMDRLICGDVGYGKTEVAMRAAFKAVMDGFQVAVLVPTTVLAQQHFDTFSARMALFPVTVVMLSRFQTRAAQARSIKDLAEGRVDIVIGTHRLVQDDIAFKNLGLVIIDEEQRFGVEHKEHIKQYRRLVDVLTLSATPIPRTLYMSLTGAKDMSTIQTPPRQRLPIETVVSEYDNGLIRSAVLHELNREGQAYFLHNRVNTIFKKRDELKKLIPEARIEVAHGQMKEAELSSTMHRFMQGAFDVLLCTTIIESGVDIPNVNTIFIDRADRFGMADLYQLRGRVGRYRNKAYAYLLLPGHMRLFDAARKRVETLKRYSSFGAGFKLALKDLEIRGAGNLLGSEQSGHIAAVGFDLYCQLLKRTVAMMKGEAPPPVVDVELRLDFISLSTDPALKDSAAVIPVTYVEDEDLRMKLYRQWSSLAAEKEIRQFADSLKDRFGALPPPVKHLLEMARIKVRAALRNVMEIEVRGGKIMIKDEAGYWMKDSRFPRLERGSPLRQLKQITAFLKEGIE